MASQQAYNAYTQNKGTLVPGQSIAVNKFTVQVERYLSQGGFAHVYLVRTATPVYNTTHHVLKRIAVSNEAMLTEVKKEVDVMRLLKGHPNIVHLIDAAWHKMPNGMYEVFILMEFCPGGGIIDMMNRRLRERLTEAEILQIFVDVCEGVACMHNLRPALLHRDLKVENILQSSPTSYKLCDFGSATTVSRPPATTQEIRALEADLNRHTTLQYRAPEMVDVYSRRPVDEKTSMLQEHGVRRPSVFELLSHVHRLRGTKSRFKYTIPTPQPLSPRPPNQFVPSPSPNHTGNLVVSPNRVSMSVSPSRGQGIYAREKVMEAIAPLRRGDHTFEPGSSSSSPPLDPYTQPMRRGRPSAKEVEPSVISQKPKDAQISKPGKNWLDGDLIEGGESWKPMAISESHKNLSADAWNVNGKDLKPEGKKDKIIGFGDDFVEKIWDSVGGTKFNSQPEATSKSPLPTRQLSSTNTTRASPDRDAFEGLGFGTSSQKPAPTLAEARKLRTGLAVMNTSFQNNPDKPGSSTTRVIQFPRQQTPQTQPYLPPVHSQPPNLSTTSSFRPAPTSRKGTPGQADGLSAETRFPSLEELDASFSPGLPSDPNVSSPLYQTEEKYSPISKRNGPSTRSIVDASLLNPESLARGAHSRDGTRSEQVTGIAMREPRGAKNDHNGTRVPVDSLDTNPASHTRDGEENDPSSRPNYTRKHRSSVTTKQVSQPNSKSSDDMTMRSTHHGAENSAPRLPPRPRPKDWLTGDEDIGEGSSTSIHLSSSPMEKPVLRESPSKRASVIMSSSVPIQDAVVAQHDHMMYSRKSASVAPPEPPASPTLSRFTHALPPIDSIEKPNAVPVKSNSNATRSPKKLQDDSLSSGEDEGPEDATGIVPQPKKVLPQRSHKGRQSSVHDLVDLYGGGLSPKEKEARNSSINTDSLQRLKGRQAGASAGISDSNPASASSQTLPSHTATSSRPVANEHRHPAPSNGPTPSPSRSRHQSMFIFPSKSSDSYSASQSTSSASLVPPEDPTHRTRRTSITDIVQRYEGIVSVAKPVGLPSSPRPLGKLISVSNDGRYSRGQPGMNNERTSTLPSSIDLESPIDATRKSPHKISTPIPLQHDTINKESDDIMSRTPKTSLKPELVPVRPRFPTRRTTDETPPRSTEIRSSSPERPYQGVGKLIDQWQRKTAEAEPPRAVLRGRGGGFVAKRP
ncbi:hypothetical protein H0H81_007533 [Sphagnurus paluster]|uniref:non-specific serine/threonine protein kinase n=1 Tax=Sphagnurus paluster TaxID=117069 RepID=A0A9P7FR17_9AGAR|nr:hypothetical protein H0H81_007533 [Sphagnurus paluster]